MPTRRVTRRRVAKRRTRRVRGGSLWNWIKNKVNPWLKKKRYISRALKHAGKRAPALGYIGRIAEVGGYGKPSRRRGARKIKYRRRRRY